MYLLGSNACIERYTGINARERALTPATAERFGYPA